MASLNKVMLIGNVCRDPEIRMAGTLKIASFSLAVNEKYKDRNGESVDKTEFINCSALGKIADIVEQYVKKGDPIYTEGKFETQSWDDKEGNKKYKTEVKLNLIQMLGQRREQGQAIKQEQREYNSSKVSEDYSQEVVEDDLPF